MGGRVSSRAAAAGDSCPPGYAFVESALVYNPNGTMNCPYCNSEVPSGITHCPSCGGSVPDNASAGIPDASVKTSIPATFAWILALLPALVFVALSVPAGMLPEDASEETFAVIGWIGLILYLGANCFILHKDEKLLAKIRRRDEMLVFLRIGILFVPAYLCARAAKIDRNWAYAIVGSIIGIWWWGMYILP